VSKTNPWVNAGARLAFGAAMCLLPPVLLIRSVEGLLGTGLAALLAWFTARANKARPDRALCMSISIAAITGALGTLLPCYLSVIP
jgi:thiol:disulfide interchange protein